MEKNRNPNAAEIALPLNAFPVQSGFGEYKNANRKNGEKRGIFGSRDANLRKAVFKAI